jgi:hypothetical protein
MRKKFVVLVLTAMLFALCVSGQAQQPAKVSRIGYLTNAPLSASLELQDAFRQGLASLGTLRERTSSLNGALESGVASASARWQPSWCVSR